MQDIQWILMVIQKLFTFPKRYVNSLFTHIYILIRTSNFCHTVITQVVLSDDLTQLASTISNEFILYALLMKPISRDIALFPMRKKIEINFCLYTNAIGLSSAKAIPLPCYQSAGTLSGVCVYVRGVASSIKIHPFA